jgi:hypothetical protein
MATVPANHSLNKQFLVLCRLVYAIQVAPEQVESEAQFCAQSSRLGELKLLLGWNQQGVYSQLGTMHMPGTPALCAVGTAALEARP